MSAKQMLMEHLTQLALCMLAVSVISCVADDSYESNARQHWRR